MVLRKRKTTQCCAHKQIGNRFCVEDLWFQGRRTYSVFCFSNVRWEEEKLPPEKDVMALVHSTLGQSDSFTLEFRRVVFPLLL
ncbi:hypothetical protein NPIL_477411 [Nephila pilipes]|uniref:Uncharacterized protein n=1 Tax=Nephila pilipes TaxID=299642 RepID=A0A8X6PVG5_NEPPI|nr:hypothetical protein NPIL_477411 [Nephila pilipes]